MKKLFFTLTIISFCFFSAPTVYSYTGCEQIRPHPKINFYTSYGKLEYDFSQDQMGITQIGMKHGAVEKGVFANGLATGTVKWEINVSSLSQKGYGKQFCATPIEIDFYLGFSNPTIYVSNNLRKGSCMYDLVLRHEQTHQQINIKTLEYFIPLFRQALQKISKEIPTEPIYSNSQASLHQGSTIIAHKYSERIKPLIDVFKKELQIEQGKLDNSSNYAFENSICR